MFRFLLQKSQSKLVFAPTCLLCSLLWQHSAVGPRPIPLRELGADQATSSGLREAFPTRNNILLHNCVYDYLYGGDKKGY